ncbi:MAG: AbrB/MazE/SpoVT family DNA-binding domain-containing protein [Chloroflexota bacterium]|nr:AbrB/MazE/SpoVT family DNA-binding domain-containing protein [Chloroflexota bacterium]
MTIPAEVREYLGIKTHDKVVFVLDHDGSVRLRVPRHPNIVLLRGAAGSLKEPLSWQQMQPIAYEDRFAAKNEPNS